MPKDSAFAGFICGLQPGLGIADAYLLVPGLAWTRRNISRLDFWFAYRCLDGADVWAIRLGIYLGDLHLPIIAQTLAPISGFPAGAIHFLLLIACPNIAIFYQEYSTYCPLKAYVLATGFCRHGVLAFSLYRLAFCPARQADSYRLRPRYSIARL